MRRNNRSLETKKRIARSIIFGTLFVLLVPLLRGSWNVVSICDGFSTAGVLVCAYGGLKFLAEQNAFSGAAYVLRRVKSVLFPFLTEQNGKRFSSRENASEGKRREEAEIDRSKWRIPLTVGAGYLIVALTSLASA